MKRSIGQILISAYILSFILFVFILGYFWQRDRKTPPQPIAFSHQIHVSKVGLPCTHCHTTVEKSLAAGIPPVKTCMTCHKAVAKDKPEIKKLTEYWENNEPIPWQRVYKLPARKYIYFSHKRHIKANLECVTCHGNVEVIPVLKTVPKLEMGWCMSCHNEKAAPIDCATCHK